TTGDGRGGRHRDRAAPLIRIMVSPAERLIIFNNDGRTIMQTPVEIAFRQCEGTEEMRAEIAAQVRRLEEFSPSLTSCRVIVSGPQTRHRSGDPFQVEL